MTRRLRPLVALALVALVSAGCGSSAPSETATSTTVTASGSTGSGGATKSANDQRKAVQFAECMRDNGVSGFPDPEGSGPVTIDEVVNGSSLDTSTPAWKAAITACKDLQPPGFTGHKRSAEQQAASLKFAKCVRENGVEDFPDPAPDAPLVDTNRIPSAARDGGMSMLNAAMSKCRDAAVSAGVVEDR